MLFLCLQPSWQKFSPAFISALWLWQPAPSLYITVASSSSARPPVLLCHRSQWKMNSDIIFSMVSLWMPPNLQTEESGQQYHVGYVRL